ncbi:TPA: sulfatase-like hydrolase/transferase, partial [Morganella morganii]|nr:sulfatase-like hydrolase/transferase [Morganella morganii]
MLRGTGSDSSYDNVFLLSILVIIFNSSKKAFWFFIFPATIIYSLYSPIGLIFGAPNYQYIASIFATDLLESKEFFSQIPLFNYVYPFFIIFGLLLFRFLTVRYHIDFYKNKTILCIFIFFSLVNQSPFSFFKEIINSAQKVKNELVKLNYTNVKSTWGKSILTDSSTYDNYVLVIGESARKDYHYGFGYPINNTPFISNENGLLVDGLTSGGSNTVASLRLMLTNPDKKSWDADYTKSFIDLANSAGIETYWISNQGYIGTYDTPITAIAKNSQHKNFLKYKDYNSDNT